MQKKQFVSGLYLEEGILSQKTSETGLRDKINQLGKELSRAKEERDDALKDMQELEEELHQTREEKDNALEENRNKMNELNIALLSIKTRINELLQAKKEREIRTRHLEKKIKRVK